MDAISGIPYVQVRFDKHGNRQNDVTVPPGTTDLVVVSHGWNNDARQAQELYEKLFGNVAEVTRGDAAFSQRKLAIVGVFWPSKRFDELMTHLEGSGTETGGAKSLGASNREEAEQAMRDAIERAARLFDPEDGAPDPDDAERQAKLRSLQALVADLEDEDPEAQERFVNTLRQVLDHGPSTREQAGAEDSSDRLLEQAPAIVFENAMQSAPAGGSGGAPGDARGTTTTDAGGRGDEAGQAAGIGKFVSKAANAVTNLLNLTTYFEMKQRAGTVGKNGVARLLDDLDDQVERIHLVGHSFGGRVVTAAAASSTTDKLHSMSLLQAAFSHNGFSGSARGFFRSVVADGRVKGPILVTHTKNDTAVGLAYPAASRLARDRAKGFGDADDEFGGIGSNGAQRLEDGELSATATELLEKHAAYRFEAGRIHNLRSDRFIRHPEGGDAHGFVWVPEVAWAISRAMAS